MLQTNQHARRANVNATNYARDQHDLYTEPRWISQRLFEVEDFRGTIHDPAVGSGRIVDAAREAGYACTGADIVRRSGQFLRLDFLKDVRRHQNIVCNPPFRIAPEFIPHALKLARRKVAMVFPLARIAAANGPRGSFWINDTPLERVWILSPRPSMPPADIAIDCERRGLLPSGGTEDFTWLVFRIGFAGRPEIRWLHKSGFGPDQSK
jgi:hypothetical protein